MFVMHNCHKNAKIGLKKIMLKIDTFRQFSCAKMIFGVKHDPDISSRVTPLETRNNYYCKEHLFILHKL